MIYTVHRMGAGRADIPAGAFSSARRMRLLYHFISLGGGVKGRFRVVEVGAAFAHGVGRGSVLHLHILDYLFAVC